MGSGEARGCTACLTGIEHATRAQAHQTAESRRSLKSSFVGDFFVALYKCNAVNVWGRIPKTIVPTAPAATATQGANALPDGAAASPSTYEYISQTTLP